MKINELRKFEPLNEIDQEHVDSIKAAMLAGTFSCPPLLIWADNGTIVTGSHRVTACDQLYREANMSSNCDDAAYSAVLDLDIEVVDVSEIMNMLDADDFQFDNLRSYFGGTWVEEKAKDNREW